MKLRDQISRLSGLVESWNPHLEQGVQEALGPAESSMSELAKALDAYERHMRTAGKGDGDFDARDAYRAVSKAQKRVEKMAKEMSKIYDDLEKALDLS